MIQARTGSTRLPKKVLAIIEKKTLIWHVINRVKKTKNIDQIILLTTGKKEDKILLNIAKENGILGFSGPIHDVLSRYFNCAKKFNADPIIRITADCPLMDPKIIEKLLKIYLNGDFEYVTNTLPSTFPDGLDIEIFSLNTLERAFNEARLKSEREHVTPYIRNHPEKFRIFNLKNNKDFSNFRWVVDEKKDLKFVRAVYSKLKPSVSFGYKRVLDLIFQNPELSKINSGIKRNQGYNKSLKHDKILSKKN